MAEDEEAPQEQAQETPPEEPAKRPRKRRVGGRVSLFPLSFEEAVQALLLVRPDEPPAEETTKQPGSRAEEDQSG